MRIVRSNRLGGIARTRCDQVGVFGVLERGEAEQRVDRGQAGVAGACAVVPLGFQVGQERCDRRGVQVGEVQSRGGEFPAVGDESEQQPVGVAVGGDGVPGWPGAGAGSRSVKNSAGSVRVGSWQFPEKCFEAFADDGEKFGCGLRIPVGGCRIAVAENG